MDKTLHLLIMYTMLVLMLLLFQRSRNDKRSFYLALYAIIEVVTNGIDSISIWGGASMVGKIPLIAFFAKPVTLLWVPFFYFYIRSCFSSQFKIGRKNRLHLLPFGVIMALFIVITIIRSIDGSLTGLFSFGSIEYYTIFIIDKVVRLQYVIYNVMLISMLLKVEKSRKQNEVVPNLNVNIKWLRFIVYGYALACLGAVVTYFTWSVNVSLANKMNIISIMYFFLFFFIIFYDTIAPKSFSSIMIKKQAQLSELELNNIILRLKNLLEQNPLYLDANLSLQQVSKELNEKERSISQAINTIENRNFKDFINELRIKHAIEQLTIYKEKAIFEIMFESGFNSKGSFNNAFKKYTGQTPSEYRNTLV